MCVKTSKVCLCDDRTFIIMSVAYQINGIKVHATKGSSSPRLNQLLNGWFIFFSTFFFFFFSLKHCKTISFVNDIKPCVVSDLYNNLWYSVWIKNSIQNKKKKNWKGCKHSKWSRCECVCWCRDNFNKKQRREKDTLKMKMKREI